MDLSGSYSLFKSSTKLKPVFFVSTLKIHVFLKAIHLKYLKVKIYMYTKKNLRIIRIASKDKHWFNLRCVLQM